MAVREILLLGNPVLYEVSSEVGPDERGSVQPVIADLRDTMMDFRARYGFGRAIAAPQIGVMKRIVYMHVNAPVVFINPELTDTSGEMIEVWDNCMSFPELRVHVKRHRRCRVEYLDADGEHRALELEGDLSELLQHEVDHLDGILAVQRAVDGRSFALSAGERFRR